MCLIDQHSERIEGNRAQQAQQIENQRAEAERELAKQRAQDETLQAYLDQMSTLLLEKDLRESQEDSDVRRLARARTLVVLDALGSRRQNRVLRVLEETESIRARPPIISLKYASLRDFELLGKQLLRGTDLTQAGLTGAELSETYLEDTDLSGADLTNARITEEQLREVESL